MVLVVVGTNARSLGAAVVKSKDIVMIKANDIARGVSYYFDVNLSSEESRHLGVLRFGSYTLLHMVAHGCNGDQISHM